MALAAAVLIAFALALALPPFLRPRPPDAGDSRRRNIAAAHSRLAALRAREDMSAGEAEEDESEIKMRLAAEAEPLPSADSFPAAARGPDWIGTALVLLALVPGALLMFAVLRPPEISAPDLAAAAERLQEHVEANPEDGAALALLGRTMRALDRPREAAEYFEQARRQGDSPKLMASHLGALVLAGDAKAAEDLAPQVLAAAPDAPDVAWLAGALARRRGDLESATAHWNRAATGFEDADLRAGALAALAALESMKDNAAAASESAAVVTAVLEFAHAPKADGKLWVEAYAADESGARLARRSLPAAPATVSLSDADALTPLHVMSRFDRYLVAARIVRGGEEIAASAAMPGQIVTLRLE